MTPFDGILEVLAPVVPGRDGTDAPQAKDVDGYFPADSMIRRLHSERLISFSGVRALLMQACDPLAVVGFDRHSILFDDPEKRLLRTDRMMSRMYFGNTDLALATGRQIQAMHAKVTGVVEEDYGPIPAGTPYSAADPDLMLWTLATLADSALLYQERIFGGMDREDRDAYWSDYRQIGSLLGMPDDSMPANEADLRDYIDGRLGDGSLYISREIRDRAVSIIFDPPYGGWLKLVLTPVTEAVKLSSVGFLPEEIRDLYGFGWDSARETALTTLMLQIRLGSRVWPDIVRLHPAARLAAGRTF